MKDLKSVTVVRRRQLYQKDQTCPRECQESGFVLTNILPDSRGKWMPITMNDSKLVCHVNTDAVKKHFVKKMKAR
jgi:hypothetical protein